MLSTESDMEAIADLLESKLVFLSDQLELCIGGWAQYHHLENVGEYLYYDVYELIGPMVEIIYLDFPEYTLAMARAEAANICRRLTDKLVLVIDMLADQLKQHILPVLSDGNEDTHVGAVAMVGGDLAVRIDDVQYHTDVNTLDNRTDQ